MVTQSGKQNFVASAKEVEKIAEADISNRTSSFMFDCCFEPTSTELEKSLFEQKLG